MTRLLVALTSLLALAGLVAAPGAAATSATSAAGSAEATATTATASRALTELGGCVASSDALLVKLVVDESRSLRDSDPAAARSDALSTAFDALAALGGGASGKRVEASVSTFAVDVVERVGWGPVDGAHLRRLHDVAAKTADLDDGAGTDYRLGLDSARADLRARAAHLEADGVTTCQALLFFTDGALDVDDTAGNAAAEQEMCAANGVADALRRQGATLVAFSLLPHGDPDDGRELLQAVAEGSAGSTTCGTVPIAAGTAAGAYLPVSGASSLTAVFADALARAEGYGAGQRTTCPDGQCRLDIPVDPGVDSVRVLARATGPAAALSLVLPDGTAVELPATGSVDESGVTGGWRGGLAQVTADVGEAGSGTWRLRLDGAAEVQVLYLTRWAVQPVDDAAFVRAGETTSLPLRLTRGDGAPAADGDYQRLAVEAQVADGGSQPLAGAGGDWVVDVPVPAQGFPTEVALTVSVDAVTAPSGTELPAATSSLTVPVRPPQSFPVVESTTLQLDVTGTEPAQASLRVRGSDDGPTSVRVDTVDVTGPAAAGALRVEHPGDAVVLAAGEQRAIPVRLVPENAADGTGTGTATVTLQGANGELTTQDVAVEVSLARPVNEAVRWPLVAAFTLLSVGIPYGLMLLLARGQARFPSTGTARAYVVPVTLTAAGVRGQDPTSPTLIDAERHGAAVHPRQPRARQLGVPRLPGLVLSARLRRWPPHLVQPQATATAGAGAQVAALDLARGSARGPGQTVAVNLGLADTALLVVGPVVRRDASDDAGGSGSARPVPAELVLLRLAPEQEPFDAWRQRVTLDLRAFPGWAVLHEALAAPAPEQRSDHGPSAPLAPAGVAPLATHDLDSADDGAPPPPTW